LLWLRSAKSYRSLDLTKKTASLTHLQKNSLKTSEQKKRGKKEVAHLLFFLSLRKFSWFLNLTPSSRNGTCFPIPLFSYTDWGGTPVGQLRVNEKGNFIHHVSYGQIQLKSKRRRFLNTVRTSAQNLTPYMIFLHGDLHIIWKPRNVKIWENSIFFNYWPKISLMGPSKLG